MSNYFLDKILASSADSKEVSMTLKNVVPFVILLISLFGIKAAEVSFNTVIDSFIQMMVTGGVFFTGVLTFWGALRKLLIELRIMKPKSESRSE